MQILDDFLDKNTVWNSFIVMNRIPCTTQDFPVVINTSIWNLKKKIYFFKILFCYEFLLICTPFLQILEMKRNLFEPKDHGWRQVRYILPNF